MNFVVSTYVIVEMASTGQESVVYGLLTTTSNLGGPVGQAISNQLFSLFQPSLSDSKNYIDDTPQFRRTVANSFWVTYLFSFASLAFLPLLPNQKADAQRRVREWGGRTLNIAVTLTLLLLGTIYSVTINLLSMFPDTACLGIAGGSGCANVTKSVAPRC